ncbi:hypothetical protein BU17DRAFT_66045 [Hysterangium stoloniferum]|nr:hypothetical protein BU17DRAFT_66045 [Hysterangium stoloniferum]
MRAGVLITVNTTPSFHPTPLCRTHKTEPLDNDPQTGGLISNLGYKAFNDFCLARFDRFMWDPKTRDRVNALRHRIVFTHADLVPRNVLVDKNNRVIAIIVWAMAGRRPEQWEYGKTMWAQNGGGSPEFVRGFLSDYGDQLPLHDEMCDLYGASFKLSLDTTSHYITLNFLTCFCWGWLGSI